ncbi:unnamed protein product [Paramecium octaurelia]|uniref:Uncharacterized protein n=1 Tax=Paramecium octaurelia TaxID=43137 RepID=A0A8S1SE11_PAROT|nr:unnamed protein product [Paramecium octaurelia]
MSGSITKFDSIIRQESIESLFSNYSGHQNEEQEQKITEQLTSQPIYVNNQFVRDWIAFTNDLLKKQQETQTELSNLQKLYIQAECRLKRYGIVGSGTTGALITHPQSEDFNRFVIKKKLTIIQEQLKQKKDQIPNLTSQNIDSAKIESQDILRQTQELLQQLEQYNAELLIRSENNAPSFQLLSTGSVNISDEQTWRMNQQPLQTQRENTNPENFESYHDANIQS